MKKLKLSTKVILMLTLVVTAFLVTEVLAGQGSASIAGHNITYVELGMGENWSVQMLDAPSLFDGRRTATLTEFHDATRGYHGDTVLIFPAVFFNTGGSNPDFVPIYPFAGPVRFDHYGRLSISGGVTHDPETYQVSFGALPHLLANYERVEQSAWADITPGGTYGRAHRGFMGQRSDGTLIVGNVGNANIPDLQDIAQALYLRYATNIDGGASASIMLNGAYVTRPGRQLATVLLITDTAAPLLPMAEQELTINLTVGGNIVDIPEGTAPILHNDRTLVPLRFVTESFGADVDWDAQTQTATITLGRNVTTITIGQLQDGMDVPAMLIDGRTMVPLRFIAEQFGAEVDFDPERRVVYIEMS